MKTLYLVRHGATAWNEQGRLQGREVDEPLSDQGMAQASGLAGILSAVDPEVVVASPLRRAVDTAARCGHTNPSTDDRWTENALGDWSGRHIADLIQHNGSHYTQWRHGTFTPPGAEPFDDVKRRVAEAVDDLPEEATALVFTHGGTIRAAVAALTGIEPAHIAPARPGSLCVIEATNTTGTLTAWNLRADLTFGSPGMP